MSPHVALIRHDALTCRNALRQAFRGWSDRATFLAGVPLLALIGRAAAESLDDRTTSLLGAVVGAVIGFALVRLAIRQVDYHRTEGVLAAEALRPGAAIVYTFTLAALGAMLGSVMIAAIAWRALPGFSLALPGGFAGAALVAAASSHLPLPRAICPLLRNARRRLDEPSTALLLALPVIAASAIAAATALPRDAIAIAAVVTGGAALVLAHVDPAKVRFMAQCGHPVLASVWREVRPLAMITIAVGAAAALMLGTTGAAIVIAAPVCLLFAQPLRVMLYRAYGRRTADWLFTVILSGLVLVCIGVPFVAPFAYAAMLWWTAHSTRAARWRIA